MSSLVNYSNETNVTISYIITIKERVNSVLLTIDTQTYQIVSDTSLESIFTGQISLIPKNDWFYFKLQGIVVDGSTSVAANIQFKSNFTELALFSFNKNLVNERFEIILDKVELTESNSYNTPPFDISESPQVNCYPIVQDVTTGSIDGDDMTLSPDAIGNGLNPSDSGTTLTGDTYTIDPTSNISFQDFRGEIIVESSPISGAAGGEYEPLQNIRTGDNNVIREFPFTDWVEEINSSIIQPKKDPGGEVTVFYGTNRKKTVNPTTNDYYGSERGTLELGTCTISIPLGHKQGELERPRKIFWWRLKENANEHIMLRTVTELTDDRFYEYLNEGLYNSESKAALIFVHGYNTTFTEAAWRTGQIAYDLPFSGITGFFSWPSTGQTLSYLTDGERADASVSQLEKFIENIAVNTGVEQLHFIAHSMGNRVLTRALNKLSEKESFKKSLTSICQVILAAPDIDRGVFEYEILPQFKKVGKRRTLYANDKDKALILSKKLREGLIRIGEAGDKIFISDGIDTIDASNVMSEGNHHSYMFETKELLSDLYLLICKGLKPEDRRLREVPIQSLKYWLFRE